MLLNTKLSIICWTAAVFVVLLDNKHCQVGATSLRSGLLDLEKEMNTGMAQSNTAEGVKYVKKRDVLDDIVSLFSFDFSDYFEDCDETEENANENESGSSVSDNKKYLICENCTIILKQDGHGSPQMGGDGTGMENGQMNAVPGPSNGMPANNNKPVPPSMQADPVNGNSVMTDVNPPPAAAPQPAPESSAPAIPAPAPAAQPALPAMPAAAPAMPAAPPAMPAAEPAMPAAEPAMPAAEPAMPAAPPAMPAAPPAMPAAPAAGGK